MASVVLYFHVHQPFRLKSYDLFSIGDDHNYYHTDQNRLDNQKILNKVAQKCYFPVNSILLDLLNQYPDFKISFSISGVILDQFELYAPEVIQSFRSLVDTGRVELLNETYYHSLAYLYSVDEFKNQVLKHQQKLKDVFNYTPQSFRNTELIYNNDIAYTAQEMGFKAILAEGVDYYLGWRSPNFVYHPKGSEKIRLLLKNYRLSDDIAFRFSNQDWHGYPLTAEKFAHWVSSVNGNGHVVNLFMDYETFGEHQWEDTGIFNFLRHLPEKVKAHPDNNFLTVTEAATSYPVMDEIDMPHLTSWADIERDLSAWLSNPMQHSASRALYQLESDVKATNDQQLIEDWRRLTTSDHFYYMCTKWFSDGDVHKYFSPNETPYEAFRHFMNVLHDLRLRVYTKNNSKTLPS